MNWLREEYWVFVGIHNDDITEMKWSDCPIRGDRRRRTCNAFKAQLGNWEVTFKSKECICLHFLGLIFMTYTTDVHVFISYRLDNPDNAAVCCFLFTHCVRSIELHTCMLPLFYKKEHCIVQGGFFNWSARFSVPKRKTSCSQPGLVFRWLSKFFFHFGTKNWADQLKKHPV